MGKRVLEYRYRYCTVLVPSAHRHRAFGSRPTSPDISGSPSIIYDKQKKYFRKRGTDLERKTAEIQKVGGLTLTTAKGKRFLVGARGRRPRERNGR